MSAYIVTNCQYFKIGMQELLSKVHDVDFSYIQNLNEIKGRCITKEFRVILAVELATLIKLEKFWGWVTFLSTLKEGGRIGIVITKYNAYLMKYLSKKIKGVTFFYAHEKHNDLATKISRWYHGRSRPTTKIIYHCYDKRGLTLDELIIMTLSLAGEDISTIASTLEISLSKTYRIRKKAQFKLKQSSYRDFCRSYFNGSIRLEHERPVEIRGGVINVR